MTEQPEQPEQTEQNTEPLTSQERLGLGPGGGASRSVATEQRRQGPGLRQARIVPKVHDICE